MLMIISYSGRDRAGVEKPGFFPRLLLKGEIDAQTPFLIRSLGARSGWRNRVSKTAAKKRKTDVEKGFLGLSVV